MATPFLPKLNHLPIALPIEGDVRIELEEGVPIFRASRLVCDRIEALLIQQQEGSLNPAEIEELDCYEEIDDYLSFVNRTIRNLSRVEHQQAS